MKTILLTAALASALASNSAFAQAPSVSDQDFVAKASVGNTFEMEEAKLALDKATDARLKGFAQKMIDDHGNAMKKIEDASGGDKDAFGRNS